jgi:hypothetical protein
VDLLAFNAAAPSPRTLKALMLRPTAWHPMLEDRSGWKASIRSRFPRKLSDCFGDADTAMRNS